jgi:hypothetical protein
VPKHALENTQPNWYNQTNLGVIMSTNLPAETIQISPEALEVANSYLQENSAKLVSEQLNLPLDQVCEVLARPEVRGYIDRVFFDVGYNNRFLMRRAMDAVIKRKFEELEEAGVGSGKDIADLLHLSHKMSMDLLDREIQLQKLRQETAPQKQVNVQINDDGTKYSQLIHKLISGDV